MPKKAIELPHTSLKATLVYVVQLEAMRSWHTTVRLYSAYLIIPYSILQNLVYHQKHVLN